MFCPVFNYMLHPGDNQEGIPFMGGEFQACRTITNHSETLLILRSDPYNGGSTPIYRGILGRTPTYGGFLKILQKL